MAKLMSSTVLSVFILSFSLASPGESQVFSKELSRESLGIKIEKTTQLHFYFHDIVSGKNPTAVGVARAPITATSPTGFGAVSITDDPLTLNPELNSPEVGRAQGIYASSSLSEVALLMVYNFVFTQGEYNGSTLSILGRNSGLSKVRELPVVGGSGKFRFARGYANANTFSFNATTGDAVVEYNVYVMHY